MIKERVNNGKKAKKAKGGHIGGKVPYGYRVLGSGREARLEPVQSEQGVIAQVKALLIDRPYLPVADTARALAEQGLTARNGKAFFPMQVLRIMEQVKASAVQH